MDQFKAILVDRFWPLLAMNGVVGVVSMTGVIDVLKAILLVISIVLSIFAVIEKIRSRFWKAKNNDTKRRQHARD